MLDNLDCLERNKSTRMLYNLAEIARSQNSRLLLVAVSERENHFTSAKQIPKVRSRFEGRTVHFPMYSAREFHMLAKAEFKAHLSKFDARALWAVCRTVHFLKGDYRELQSLVRKALSNVPTEAHSSNYRCEYCAASYSSRLGLNDHVSIRHSNSRLENPLTNFSPTLNSESDQRVLNQ